MAVSGAPVLDKDGWPMERRPGRWDWLIGGERGAGAAAPAIALSVLALVVGGFVVWSSVSGQLNRLDSTRVANAVADNLIDNGAKGVHVSCPAMSGEPGSVHLCTVKSAAGVGHARVTVENTDGDITWIILG